MQTTINTVLALLKAAMTTALETNTVAITTAGVFTVTLPGGVTGIASSGTATLTGSPVALSSGVNTITTTTTGNITIIANGTGIVANGPGITGGVATGSPITLTDPNTTDYFVKTWYTNDPLGMPSIETPAGAVIASQPSSRDTEFVGEDTVNETLKIRFYQLAARKQSEASEVAAGMTKLIAMFDMASLLLRIDPTFNSLFVKSKIVNIDPLMAGVPEANAYRICEITFDVTSRLLWHPGWVLGDSFLDLTIFVG